MFLDQAGIYQSERKLTIQHYVKNGDFRHALEKNVNFFTGFPPWNKPQEERYANVVTDIELEGQRALNDL
jgi:hypothetical protein